MAESVQQLKNQLNEYWQGTDKVKRKKILIIGIIVLLLIVILTYMFTRTDYEVLYTNLSLEDAGEITDTLNELGVKWETPKNDPTTILVPVESKNEVKIQLAKEGLPKDSYGFSDALSDSSWTMTDYDKQERMKLALQNELASTISEIDGINDATVYINLKDESGFVLDESQNESSASVYIESQSDRTLDSESIESIQNLVASSINMVPEKVQVIDSSGKLLSNNQSNSEMLMTDQFTIKNNLENRINLSIKNFLENLFGQGNVDIRSSVIINFDSEKTSSVEFAPPIEGNEEGLIRSMEEVQEQTSGGATQGTPGTEENVPNYNMDDGSQENYSKSSNVLNYELNQINQEIQRAPGQVEDISVAVLINSDQLEDGNLTQADREDIQDLITAATGLNTRQVVVYSESFYVSGDEIGGIDETTPSINWPILGAVIGVIVIIGILIFKRRKKQEELDKLQEEINDETTYFATTEDIDFEPGKSEVKDKIDKFVDKNPEAVAQLLRTWLNE